MTRGTIDNLTADRIRTTMRAALISVGFDRNTTALLAEAHLDYAEHFAIVGGSDAESVIQRFSHAIEMLAGAIAKGRTVAKQISNLVRTYDDHGVVVWNDGYASTVIRAAAAEMTRQMEIRR